MESGETQEIEELPRGGFRDDNENPLPYDSSEIDILPSGEFRGGDRFVLKMSPMNEVGQNNTAIGIHGHLYEIQGEKQTDIKVNVTIADNNDVHLDYHRDGQKQKHPVRIETIGKGSIEEILFHARFELEKLTKKHENFRERMKRPPDGSIMIGNTDRIDLRAYRNWSQTHRSFRA